MGVSNLKRNILIIENDTRYERLLNRSLKENYGVISAKGYAEGMAQLSSQRPDIAIIDVSADTVEARKTIESARKFDELPIIALCERGQYSSSFLDDGADIALQKPVDTEELMAYIRVCERRITEREKLSGANVGNLFVNGGLTVDINGLCASVYGNDISFTRNEFKILALLCRYNGRVLTYDFIMREIWGQQNVSGNGILRVNMANIRKKLDEYSKGETYVLTESGVGYKAVKGVLK